VAAASPSLPAPPVRTYWVKRVVLGWALFLGALGCWGWSQGETPAYDSAIVSLFACVMMLNASYQLRMANRSFTRWIWTAALVLFGSWSGYSAHHAATLSRTNASDLESLFLLGFFTISALLDPFLGWGVADNDHLAAERQPRVADTQPPVAESSAGSGTVVEFPASGGRTSAALAGALAGVAGLSAASGHPPAEAATLPAGIFEPPGRSLGTNPEQHAERLLLAKVSQRMVAERTGLSRYRVSQIAASMRERA